MKYPQTVLFEFDDPDVDPVRHPMWAEQKAKQIKAVIKNKTFVIKPTDDWKVTVPEDGFYVITHPLGTAGYSLNLALLQDGKARVVSAGDTEIKVSTKTPDDVPANLDFAFCISINAKAVSP